MGEETLCSSYASAIIVADISVVNVDYKYGPEVYPTGASG